MTKHAVVALSEAMYRDARFRGLPIGVSVLCPGWVNTRIQESVRNRPAAPRPTAESQHPLAQKARQHTGELLRKGMDPDEVGRVVLAAIQERRFYVLTHAWEALIRNRMERILEGRNPERYVPLA